MEKKNKPKTADEIFWDIMWAIIYYGLGFLFAINIIIKFWFAKWVNGDKEQAIKFLVACIQVNKPETPNNTEQMAKDTIEKWFEDNF